MVSDRVSLKDREVQGVGEHELVAYVRREPVEDAPVDQCLEQPAHDLEQKLVQADRPRHVQNGR